jgi:hypothetical protein
MSDLNDLIQSVFAGGNLEAISQHLGTSNDETAAGISAALPALLGALAGNASTPRGEQKLASVLERDHDGSLLDSLGGMLTGSLGGRAANGSGIVGHLFGDDNHQNDVVNSLAGRSGVNPSLISKMLPLLAPLVMGWLGKQMRGGNNSQAAASSDGMGMGGLGGGGLGGLLGGVLGQMMGGGGMGGGGGGGMGGGLADMLGGLLGGGQQQQAQQQPQQQQGGVDLGSILGSIFGR